LPTFHAFTGNTVQYTLKVVRAKRDADTIA
jgi:hypothetical protein